MKNVNIYYKILFLVGFFLLTAYEAEATDTRREQNKEYLNKVDTLTAYKEAVKSESSTKDYVFYVDEWIKSWFVRLDTDQDNHISQDELVANLENFDLKEYHLAVFDENLKNPDGTLSLKEFKSFVDTTDIFTEEELARAAMAKTGTTDSFDVVKLLAGVVAISLLMAAFRLM